MSVKRTLITMAVQLLAANTDLIAKPDATSEFINSLFGIETQEQRLVNEIDQITDKAVAKAKKIKLDRDFKKVTQNY